MYGVTPWTRLSSGKGPVQTTAARTIRGPDRLGAEKGQRAACPALFKVMWARWGWPQGQAKAWLKHWGVTRRGRWAAGVAPLQEVRAGTGAWGSCRPLGAPGPWSRAARHQQRGGRRLEVVWYLRGRVCASQWRCLSRVRAGDGPDNFSLSAVTSSSFSFPASFCCSLASFRLVLLLYWARL